jgi:hypothetical protein
MFSIACDVFMYFLAYPIKKVREFYSVYKDITLYTETVSLNFNHPFIYFKDEISS